MKNSYAVKIFLFLAAARLCASPVFAQNSPSAAKRIFSVADAVFYALKNNQQMFLANEEIEIARAKIRETNALVYPKIDFNLNASRYETATPFVLGDALGSVYYDARRTNASNYTAKFALAQYIYAGGRYTSNMRLARTNLLIAETNREILISKIRADVKTAYYETIYAKERLALVKGEMERLAASKNPADAEEFAALKREFFAVDNLASASRMKFLSAMGLELNTQFEITGTLETEFKDFDSGKLVAQAYQYRRELNKVAIQETIDALSVSLLQAERFPAVMLGGVYEMVDVNLSDNKKNWAMFVNLNLPIFDGWASWARLDAKKSQSRQSGIRKVDTEDAIAYEVLAAHMSYESYKKKVRFDDENLAAVSSLPRPEPQKIFRAKLNLLESRLEAVSCLINLEKAVGKELL